MPEQKDGTTTTKSTSDKSAAFPSVDEAVTDALKQVGKGAATESAKDKTEKEREDETTDSNETDETTTGTTESEDEDQEQADDEKDDAEPLLTADDFDDLKPGQQINVPLKSVRQEDRDYVRRVKANLSRAFQQAAAERRRNGEDQNTDKAQDKKQEKTFTRDELFEMAQEGPEGFERANEILMEQKLDTLLAKRNIKPPSEQDLQSQLVDDAIEVAVGNEYPELNDQRFRMEVATLIKTDDVTARRFDRALKSNDPEQVAIILERAADRVKELRYKRTEAARAKAKMSKETETAKEKGSVAATSNTKGSPAASSGPVAVDKSVDAALKQVGGNAFR